MSFFDFFKFKKPEPPKEDWTTIFPKEVVDGLLNEIKSNPQACRADEIPQGIGEFGLEKTNPIPTYGIPENEKAIIVAMKIENGESYLSLEEVTVTKKTFKPKYEKLSPELLKSRLKMLDNLMASK